MGEYLCFVAAGFYRFWSTSHNPPPPNPAGYLRGARYAISAEDAKANNKKAKQKKHNKDKKDNTNDAL